MNEREIYIAAIQIPDVALRAAFLNAVCKEDILLRHRIESLLGAEALAGSLVSRPVKLIEQLAGEINPNQTRDDIPEIQSATESISRNGIQQGTTIGPYKIQQLLGEGGMGVVYVAKQTEPVKRLVALKILRPGENSRNFLSRFEQERHALAMMDHPGIAKILDAGTTADSRPYFVMELVKGIPISDYCDRESLSLQERLQIFVSVCAAVQHAHQKGIIHRDLKPSNILVALYDGRPTVKVIDFGIAKAIGIRLSGESVYTEVGSIIGTIEYMAPEQAELNNLDIDTRADVYALGVVMYELLTGSPPFSRQELRKATFHEMLRTIREVDPPTPGAKYSSSDQIASIAAHRKLEPRQLSRLLSGDLNWIVMKCLDKDRNRRYDSPNHLAEDLNRFLNHQPVVARRPSLAYRMQKLCRRQRVLVRVAMLATVLLSISAFLGWQYRQSSADARRGRIEVDLAHSKNAALEKLDVIQNLVDRGDFQSAYNTLLEIETVIGEHPRLAKLRDSCSRTWTFSSNITGTEIWRRDYASPNQSWVRTGIISEAEDSIRVPLGVYLWKATKDGYRDVTGLRLPESAHFDLDKSDQLPADMVRIPKGPASRPSQAFAFQYGTFELPSYFIDRYEVSNAAFARFVVAGGYDNPIFWQDLEFTGENQNAISWADARLKFVDKTGKPGPATWENGTYVNGTGSQPVTGVSWFEAMAYARFAKKELPTVYHWETATQHEFTSWITLGLIIDRFQFGDRPVAPEKLMDIGVFGTGGTGGNAKEWVRNATASNDRFILGGGFGETLYKVVTLDYSCPILRNNNFGFRCMKSLEGESPELSQSIASIPWADPPDSETLLDKKTFDLVVADRFTYDHSRPLDVKLEQRDEGKWMHLTASFNAAYPDVNGNPDRVLAHLYLPKTIAPPEGFQTVVYMPPLDAAFLAKIRPLDKEYGLEQIVASGRAVLRPIYAGSFDRKQESDADDDPTMIKIVQDLMRANDFLIDRDDIDESKIAFYGFSLGAIYGYPALAVDERYKAAIFQGAGLPVTPVSQRNILREEAFTWPMIQIPVLMIGGEDDQIRPIEQSQRPMLALLGSVDKELVVCPGGHMLPSDVVMEKIIPWLDKRFGVPATR